MSIFIKIAVAGMLSIGALSACSSSNTDSLTDTQTHSDSSLHELLNTRWELTGIQLPGSDISGQTIKGLHVNNINVAVLNHPNNTHPLMRIGGNAVPVCGAAPIWVRFEKDNRIIRADGPVVPTPAIACIGPEAEAGKEMGKYLNNFTAYELTNLQLKLITRQGARLIFKKQCSKPRQQKISDLECPL